MARGAALTPLAMALLLLAIGQRAAGELVIDKAARQIDASTYVVRVRDDWTLRNAGAEPATSFLLCDARLEHAPFLEASQEGSTKRLEWVPAEAPAGAPPGTGCRRFTLPAPLAPGATGSYTAAWALSHVLAPEPAEVAQRDPQNVLFEGSSRWLSPYRVATQTLEITTGGGKVHTFTEPATLVSGRLTYGPYADAAPWAVDPISVHFENNAPFLDATRVEREVQLSPWGTAYVEERYAIRHAGARVSGEWSRFDLNTKSSVYAQAAAPALAARLPPTARHPFYRDAIGNISSSATRYSAEEVRVDLIPRYPLFGGWSTTFLFGWTQPLGAVVTKDAKTGRMRFSAQLGPAVQHNSLVVDELVIKVVLPEGAGDVRVEPYAFPLAAAPEVARSLTYLDVLGRPTVVLRLRNFVYEMGQSPLQITYTTSSMALLQKPLLLIAAVGAIFGASVVLNRGATLGSSPSSAKLHAA